MAWELSLPPEIRPCRSPDLAAVHAQKIFVQYRVPAGAELPFMDELIDYFQMLPSGILEEISNPYTGIAVRQRYLPSLFEIREFAEDLLRPIQQRLARSSRAEEARRLTAPVRAYEQQRVDTELERNRRIDEAIAKMKAGGGLPRNETLQASAQEERRAEIAKQISETNKETAVRLGDVLNQSSAISAPAEKDAGPADHGEASTA